jgi:hypothetical protein
MRGINIFSALVGNDTAGAGKPVSDNYDRIELPTFTGLEAPPVLSTQSTSSK